MKKSVPWSFRFTGEASHVKTKLRSLESFPRVRELTGDVQMFPFNGFQHSFPLTDATCNGSCLSPSICH